MGDMAIRNTTLHTTRLVPAKRASREYGIAYGSLRDICHRGEIQVVKVGRAWYLDRSDIDRWIETRKREWVQ